jgi:hypothetical protein
MIERKKGLPTSEQGRENLEQKRKNIESEVSNAGLNIDGRWHGGYLVYGISETGKVSSANFAGPDGPPNYPRSEKLRCQIDLCIKGDAGQRGTGLTYRDMTEKMETVHESDSIEVSSSEDMSMENFIAMVNGIVQKINQE